MTEKNSPKKILLSLGIINEESLIEFYPTTRDNPNIAAIKCNNSGVIFLSSSDQILSSYYHEKDKLEYWNKNSFQQVKNETHDDDYRRFNYIRKLILNKDWVDIGSGLGGILDLAQHTSLSITAVEPQNHPRKLMQERGITAYSDTSLLEDNSFDVATMFHVFEHLSDPISLLQNLRIKMKKDGLLIIEVPHARDALLSWFKLDEFKKFTLWSEHLILHTRESLRKFIEKAGFSVVSIEGIQRYPLANHLHWLSQKKPGGHVNWHQMSNDNLDREYSLMLSKLDLTDTLIVVAKAP